MDEKHSFSQYSYNFIHLIFSLRDFYPCSLNISLITIKKRERHFSPNDPAMLPRIIKHTISKSQSDIWNPIRLLEFKIFCRSKNLLLCFRKIGSVSKIFYYPVLAGRGRTIK